MLSRKLSQEYLTLYGEYDSRPFSLQDASKLLDVPSRVLRYDVHKMKRDLALEALERGIYRTVEPEKWIGIAMALQKFPALTPFYNEILSKLPDMESIMLYGSRIRGDYRKDSDYDLLIVTNGKPLFSEEDVESLKKKGFQATVSYESALKKQVRENPVSIVPILREAWPLFNRHVKDRLLGLYKEEDLLKDLKRISKSIIESKYVVSPSDDLTRSLLFLAFTRSRQLYLVETLIEHKDFSNQEWLERIGEFWGIKSRTVKWLYRLYREIEKGEKSELNYVTEEQLNKIAQGNLLYARALIRKK